jgi:gluconolactonase
MNRSKVIGVCLAALCVAGIAGTSLAQEGPNPICDTCELELYSSCGEGKFLEGPNFADDGTMWLVGLRSGEILKVDPDGTCSVAGVSGGFPGGARLDAAGKLLVTDRIGLLAYDTETGTVEELASRFGNENMRGLNDLVVDSEGGVYFTEPYGSDVLEQNGRVFYYSPETQAVTLIGDTFACPNGVMLSPDETRLYVGDYATNRILLLPLASSGKLNDGANAYVFAYMQGGVGPDGMVVDTDGNLYVAHYRAGEVVVYDPNGMILKTFTMPDGAGLGTTNLVLHDGYLYITEALKNEIWRVAVNTTGHNFFE